MTWLSGWNKRIKITIDKDDVDANLTDFPALIYLSGSSGINGKDVTAIFDEVGANSLKIAVTTLDGETECYVEIERWDSGNEKAWLWVKVPSVSSTEDTILYIYYDNTHADNTTYVGVPNSTPAENVWDANFKLVDHLQDDPDNASTRDSTTNDNDGVKKAANEPIEIDGQIARAQEFDGLNDFINCGGDASLNVGNADFSVEMWVYPEGNVGLTVIKRPARTASIPFQISVHTTRIIVDYFDPVNGWVDPHNKIIAIVGWHHIVVNFIYATMETVIYLDGVNISAHTHAFNTVADATAQVYMGARATGLEAWQGLLDEVRIYNRVLTPAEIRADYESGRDHFLIFGGEETWHDVESGNPVIGTSEEFCELTSILGWEERASRIITKKRPLGRCCPTPAPEEGYIAMPREIRIITRMDRDERDSVDKIWGLCSWLELYDRDDEFIDYVWLEEPNFRWDSSLGCGGKPWIATLSLVCSST